MVERQVSQLLQHPSLLTLWDFQEQAGESRVSKGQYTYSLQEENGPILQVTEGLLGPYAAQIQFGQWFKLSRQHCPALNFHGKDAAFTIIGWLKREDRSFNECQAIAGMWNETDKQRQYCMFLDLSIWDSGDQVCGHVSSSGGPTPGYPYCMTSAIGQTMMEKDQWYAVAFSYDGQHASVYLDGELDRREQWNPYYYPEGIYDGQEDGADFTVAAVYRAGEMGNFFAGTLGGLAIYSKSLSSEEIHHISILPLQH